MKRLFFLSIVLLLFLPLTATAKTYKICTVPWAGWSPAHVAESKGFWKQEGIDVKVFTAKEIQQRDDFFKSGRVDITFLMMGTAVKWYTEGNPVTVIAETDWSHGGDKIIARKGVDMKTLKNKPIGVYYNNPSVTFFINKYLTTIGFNISEFKIIEMDAKDLVDNFIAKRFNLIVCYDPQALRAEKEGNGETVATTATFEGCMPEGMVMLSDTLKSTPRADLVKIHRGWVKAVQWSKDPKNLKDYLSILNDVTFKGMDPFPEKDLLDMLDAVRIHDRKTQFERNRDQGGLMAFLEDMKKFFRDNGMLKKEFMASDLFDNRVVTRVLREEM